MRRAVIVHGWEGHPEECWFPWLTGELEELGYSVEVPQMPVPEKPRIDRWVPHLASVVGKPDDGLVLVGHSAGCITILRYLEGLSDGQRIGKAVLVAGFTGPLGFDELKNWFESPIDWDAIKSHCQSFVAINSDNDPYVPLSHADVLRDKLGATVVIERGKGHMGGEDGFKELPSALEAVK